MSVAAPRLARSASDLSKYGPLFRNLVRREVRQRYKGSVLGLAWTLVTPAIMVGAYSLVFKFLLRIQIEYYALFLFVGLTVWTFFLGGAQVASRSLVANASLVTKVSFPRQIVPLSALTANAFTAGAMLVVALPLCMLLSEDSLLPLVALPGLIVLLAAFTAGFGLAVAALNVYFRDVEHILGVVLLAWYFLTPVLYPISVANDPRELFLLQLNPMTGIVVGYQRALLDGLPPDWPIFGYSVAVALALFLIGFAYFRRAKDDFESYL
jgi:lipopolysaccharide transport system permease protein